MILTSALISQVVSDSTGSQIGFVRDLMLDVHSAAVSHVLLELSAPPTSSRPATVETAHELGGAPVSSPSPTRTTAWVPWRELHVVRDGALTRLCIRQDKLELALNRVE